MTTVLITHGSWAGEIAGILFKLRTNVVMADSAEDVQKFYKVATHVLIPGGSDISPEYYGEKNRWCGYINKDRDAIDNALVDTCLLDKKPLLGICRGHQMITVVAGGTLVQDMTKDLGVPSHYPTHRVATQRGSWMRHVVGSAGSVNSYHHQATLRVPKGWEATAWADDGVIEAIEHSTLPVLSVQWHPEVLKETHSENLFRLFLSFRQKGATKYAASKR